MSAMQCKGQKIRPFIFVCNEIWYQQTLAAYLYGAGADQKDVLAHADGQRLHIEQSAQLRQLRRLYPKVAERFLNDMKVMYRWVPKALRDAQSTTDNANETLGDTGHDQNTPPSLGAISETIFYLRLELAFGHEWEDIRGELAQQMYNRAVVLFDSHRWKQFRQDFPNIAQRAVQFMNHQYASNIGAGVERPISQEDENERAENADPWGPRRAKVPSPTPYQRSLTQQPASSSTPPDTSQDYTPLSNVGAVKAEEEESKSDNAAPIDIGPFPAPLPSRFTQSQPPQPPRAQTTFVVSDAGRLAQAEREQLRVRFNGHIPALAEPLVPEDNDESMSANGPEQNLADIFWNMSTGANDEQPRVLRTDVGEKIRRVRDWMQANRVSVRPDAEPLREPVLGFDQAPFPAEIRRVLIANFGSTGPTPIQSMVWAYAAGGRDLLVMAPNSAGKTLAAILPAIAGLCQVATARITRDGPYVLVLEPTAELARQVGDVIAGFIAGSHLNVGVFTGGNRAQKKAQTERFVSSWLDIAVCTPPRFLELLQRKYFRLSHVKYVILDEADRTHQIHGPVLRELFTRHGHYQLGAGVQSTFVSATWPRSVYDWAADVMAPGAVLLQVGRYGWDSTEGAPMEPVSPNPLVQQHVFAVRDEVRREQKLIDIVIGLARRYAPDNVDRQNAQVMVHMPKTVIFVNDRRTVDQVARALFDATGVRVTAINRHMDVDTRFRLLQDFLQRGRHTILVTSPFLTRGLDMPEVGIVVLYDLPDSIEEYVQLIGRTGRNEQLGYSYALFHVQLDIGLAPSLVAILDSVRQEVPQGLRELAESEQRAIADAARAGVGASASSSTERGEESESMRAARLARANRWKNKASFSSSTSK